MTAHGGRRCGVSGLERRSGPGALRACIPDALRNSRALNSECWLAQEGQDGAETGAVDGGRAQHGSSTPPPETRQAPSGQPASPRGEHSGLTRADKVRVPSTGACGRECSAAWEQLRSSLGAATGLLPLGKTKRYAEVHEVDAEPGVLALDELSECTPGARPRKVLIGTCTYWKSEHQRPVPGELGVACIRRVGAPEPPSTPQRQVGEHDECTSVLCAKDAPQVRWHEAQLIASG